MNKKSDFPKVKYRLVNRMGSQTFYSPEAVRRKIDLYRTEDWCKDDPVVQPQYIVKITEEYIDVADMEKEQVPQKYILTGIAIPFNKPSSHGRVYTEESIPDDVFKDFLAKVKDGKVLGVLEQRHYMNSGFDSPLSEITHKVIDVQKTERGITVELEILDTPKGQLVKTMLNSGVALWPASRSFGKVDENKICHIDTLVSFDLTGCTAFDPGEVEPLNINGKTIEQYADEHLCIDTEEKERVV